MELRILKDEEIDKIISDEWGDTHYIGAHRALAKEQYQTNIKGLIELLASKEFYNDWGGDSAKDFRDLLIKELTKEDSNGGNEMS